MSNIPQASSCVSIDRHGPVLVVALDHPPVNALGVDVRRGIVSGIEAAEQDPDIRAVLLVGRGRGFAGGADIREFGKPPQSPTLPEVCQRIEACAKPVIAAIHGAGLGGGLEVALAAPYRVALRSARPGLPEVQLGLLPGAGGTQRAPRLIGIEAALDLILSGRHVGADEALKLGLVDRVAVETDALAAGLGCAHDLLPKHAPVRPPRDLHVHNLETAPAALAATRRDLAR